jgi:uncharacterized membrane protein YcaP (DUF421 family)
MIESFRDHLDQLLGLHTPAGDLTFLQMGCRSFIVFAVSILLVRVADRRLVGRNAGFDMMVVVILGSVLSRGINGQAAFFPSLGASAVLIIFHHLLATAAFQWPWFSRLVKGREEILVRNGKVDRAALRRCKITNDDLDENLRLNGNETSIEHIVEARLERNGSVSVVKAKSRGAGH